MAPPARRPPRHLTDVAPLTWTFRFGRLGGCRADKQTVRRLGTGLLGGAQACHLEPPPLAGSPASLTDRQLSQRADTTLEQTVATPNSKVSKAN